MRVRVAASINPDYTPYKVCTLGERYCLQLGIAAAPRRCLSDNSRVVCRSRVERVAFNTRGLRALANLSIDVINTNLDESVRLEPPNVEEFLSANVH